MIRFGNIEDGRTIAAAIPTNYNPAIDQVISRVEDDKLLGGVIYYGYTGAAIFIHQAGFDKRWMNRDMLWVCFDYPFNQLNCNKLCGTIPAANKTLLALNLRLGFRQEAVIKDAYPDGDMAVLTMTRDECPWLKIKPRSLQVGNI